MSAISGSIHNENGLAENQWGRIYKIGAFSSVIVLLGTIFDITAGSILGGDLSRLPSTAVGRYAQLLDNPLLGLYNLDLLNTIIQIISIPVYLALYAAHRKSNKGIARLAFIFFLVGTTLFAAGNTALTMYDLSIKYAAASSDAQRMLIAAAGEAMLAKGAHGSAGVFIGFILPCIAGLIMSFAMLSGKVFSRLSAYLGIFGNCLIILYLILVTFVPGVKTMAVAFAAPGGLMLMTWMIMFTLTLFKLSGEK